MPFEAVIFDLDGTLLDTLEDLADSMNAVLAGMGAPGHPVRCYRYFVGDGVRAMAQRALPEGRRSADEVDAAVAQMSVEYGNRWDVKTKPYDGTAALLDSLATRSMKTAVLSNKPHESTKLCVEKLLGRWRFDVVQGVDEHVKPKPDPSGALAVARKLGVAPDGVLYLGDTNTDMCTAVAAGMHPVGAAWGFRDEQELLDSGAKAVIARPEGLLDLVGE